MKLLSRVRLFETPWIAARQASLSITNSQSSLRLTSIESVMPSSHLILCHPLLLLPSIPTSIRVFSNKSTLRMRWPKYWSFSFSICPSNEYSGVLLGIHTKETRIERDTCTPTFIAALFTIVRTWKQPRCPFADEWRKKLWYIYTMEYYSAIKKNAFESVLMR